MAGFIGSPPMNFFEGAMESGQGGLVFRHVGFDLRVADGHAAKLAGHAGKPVVFGIRPEDLEDALFVSAPPPDQQIKAKVEVIEPMGAETFLYLNAVDTNFVARVDAHEKATENQELTMIPDMRKAHFFEPGSGQLVV